MDLLNIGKRIQELREQSGLTQTSVAEYLSFDQSYISKIEKGERSITSDIIEKLAALFCCSVGYILLEDDSEQECVISFRSSDLKAEDLKELATINKIVINQFEMDKMLEGE